MSGLYYVIVTGFKGLRLQVDLCDTEEQFRSLTVKDLKRKISQRLPPNTEEDRISLIFADERVDVESKLLTDYGIQHAAVIQIVLQVDGGGGPLPEDKEDQKGNMGDRDGKNISMDCLRDFQKKP